MHQVAIRPNNGKICAVVKIHVGADENKRSPKLIVALLICGPTNASTICKEILTYIRKI